MTERKGGSLVREISEENIVQGILAKDEDTLSQLLDSYGSLIKSIISKHMRLLPNYQEECFNDVLLAIWDNIQSYNKEKSSLKNWIAGIARFKAISYVRKYLKDIANEDIDTAYDLADEKSQQSLADIENQGEFNRLIEGLKPEDRELFTRIFYHEETIEQVGSSMQMSPAVIYNRLSRGKKKLRLFLGGKE